MQRLPLEISKMQQLPLEISKMLQLPLERVYQILLPLSPTDIALFCQTNQQFRDVCQDQYFWQLKYKHEYGPVNFKSLIEEFPDVYPDNWRLAYQYRSLTEKYSKIYFVYQTTLEEIRRNLETGHIQLTDVSPSALRLLGRWNPQQLLPEFIQEYQPANLGLTEEELIKAMEDFLESDGEHVGDKNLARSMGRIDAPTNLFGFTSLSAMEEWFHADTEEEEAEVAPMIIGADEIVTPRIITIVIQIYEQAFIRRATQRQLPPTEYPQFEYTYTSTGPGFTLKQLYLLSKESVRKYLYIAKMIFAQANYDLNNIGCNEIQYRNGKYYPQAFTFHNPHNPP
jgi:hypothetical protein